MAAPTQEVVALLQEELGHRLRYAVGVIGQSEWPTGSQFFDNDSVLAVTEDSFKIYKPQKRGFGRRWELHHLASFRFADMSDPGAASDEDGTPKMISFEQDPQVVKLMDIWRDPSWDDFVGFWARQMRGPGGNGSSDQPSTVSTDWLRVKGYLHQSYKLQERTPALLKMVFDLPDDRSQLLFVELMSLMDGEEEWVSVESPVGPRDAIDPSEMLTAVEGIVVGGLAGSDDGKHVVLRHSLRIRTIDLDELDRVITLVCVTADRLERKLVGGDAF